MQRNVIAIRQRWSQTGPDAAIATGLACRTDPLTTIYGSPTQVTRSRARPTRAPPRRNRDGVVDVVDAGNRPGNLAHIAFESLVMNGAGEGDPSALAAYVDLARPGRSSRAS